MTPPFGLGPWQVHPAANRLRRGGEEVRLEPKVMDLLVALAARAGEVVPRDELLDSVWPRTFVSDEVLTTAVYQLRRALGDDAREPWLVETVPKRGYRLLAAVEPVREAPGVGAAPAPEEGLSRPPRHPLPRTGARAGAWRWSAAVAVALALAALGLGRLGPHATPGPDPELDSGLDPELGPELGPEHPAAAAALRRGWEALERTGPEAASEALALLERAVVLAPEDPRGLAGLAEALVRAPSHGLRPRAEAMRRARAAAEAAIALGSGRPDSHRALALVRLADWDFAGAAASLGHARSLDPDDPRVLSLLAQLHFVVGRPEAALAAMDSARRLAPGSPAIQSLAGSLAAVLDRPGLAERAYRRALALEPGAEDPARGLAKLRAGATAGPAASPPPDARELLSRLASKADGGRLAPSHVASLYAELGDEREAVEWLDRALRSRDPGVFFLRYDTRWEPYLDHPRVRALLRRLSASGGLSTS